MSAPSGDTAAALRSLVAQLDASQWVYPAEIEAGQRQHVARLAEHAQAQSPFFADRLTAAGLTPRDLAEPGGLARLPAATRRDFQAAAGDLYCRTLPRGHGAAWAARTSGSTGEPVVIRRTGVSALFPSALAMREILWHGRDCRVRLASIRANVTACSRRDDWGPPASVFGPTGPLLTMPITASVEQLAGWCLDFQPGVLIVYPGTLGALASHFRRSDTPAGTWLPALRFILTIGETLSPSIRAQAEETFGASVADCYSSQEAGYIALECPASGLYHVMAESVIVEVVDDEGRACDEGDIGRVVITDLHNYATPLIRYDIGDFAEAGPPCPCGRGLPTLRRIAGRQRNLVLMPDGSRHWPVMGLLHCREVAPVVQYQIVQEGRETIEARLVVERQLNSSEEEGVRGLLRQAMGHPFAVRLSYFSGRIPSGPSGKYEEFVCDIDSTENLPSPVRL